MFDPTTLLIRHCIEQLQRGYRCAFGSQKPEYADLLGQVAAHTLHAIAHTDALYHDVEHTILVALVGQEILRGRQLLDGSVTPEKWLHFIIALLCHDIGYLKGICQQDDLVQQTYATGIANETVAIAPGATDASLTPYHVDRSKQFVAEKLAHYRFLDVAAIQQMIELTRFPIPNDELHRDTFDYPGLARAADLIGQLGDSRYLDKLPALFHEFEETGTTAALGYQHPGDLRRGYPTFFRTVVYPLIQPAAYCLAATQEGKQILADLYNNVSVVEQELAGEKAPSRDLAVDCLTAQERYHFFLDESQPIEVGNR